MSEELRRLALATDAEVNDWVRSLLAMHPAIAVNGKVEQPLAELPTEDVATLLSQVDQEDEDRPADQLRVAMGGSEPKLARALLAALAEEPGLVATLARARTTPPPQGLLIGTAVAGAALVFILSLDVEFGSEKRENGKKVWHLKIKRKPTKDGLTGKVLKLLGGK
jgi:hypothetical protein